MRARPTALFLVTAIGFAAACRPRETAPAPGVAETPAPTRGAAPTAIRDAGFQTPESVLYDAEADVYLISNINGSPVAADSNGFISRVSPDGTVTQLKWIDGTRPAQKLHAPKGMAISGDLLYVADLTAVRIFERLSGASRGKIDVLGTTFLNDLATGPDGTMYVSDSGLSGSATGLEPNGSDAIYRIGNDGKPVPMIKDKSLGNPNGLLADATGLWVVTFGSGELYRVTADGRKESAQKLPSGQLDGIVQAPDGSLLISSWEAGSVFRGTAGGTFTAVVTGVSSPADLGWDPKRNRVLIPLFTGDAVEIRSIGP